MEPTTSCCFASHATTELMPLDARREGDKKHVDIIFDAVVSAWILSGLVFGIMTVAFFALAFIMRFI